MSILSTSRPETTIRVANNIYPEKTKAEAERLLLTDNHTPYVTYSNGKRNLLAIKAADGGALHLKLQPAKDGQFIIPKAKLNDTATPSMRPYRGGTVDAMREGVSRGTAASLPPAALTGVAAGGLQESDAAQQELAHRIAQARLALPKANVIQKKLLWTSKWSDEAAHFVSGTTRAVVREGRDFVVLDTEAKVPLCFRIKDVGFPYHISANGRFLVGEVETPEGGKDLAIWDLTSGSVGAPPGPAHRLAGKHPTDVECISNDGKNIVFRDHSNIEVCATDGSWREALTVEGFQEAHFSPNSQNCVLVAYQEDKRSFGPLPSKDTHAVGISLFVAYAAAPTKIALSNELVAVRFSAGKISVFPLAEGQSLPVAPAAVYDVGHGDLPQQEPTPLLFSKDNKYLIAGAMQPDIIGAMPTTIISLQAPQRNTVLPAVFVSKDKRFFADISDTLIQWEADKGQYDKPHLAAYDVHTGRRTVFSERTDKRFTLSEDQTQALAFKSRRFFDDSSESNRRLELWKFYADK